MNKAISILVFWVLLGSSIIGLANGPRDFPPLVNADIPGAPKLSKPILIMGTTGPVKSEGQGWAAPAFWDWDEDGKKDLLIGEFNSGTEHGKFSGSFVRVYRNIGSNATPEFSDNFHYAYYAEMNDRSPNGSVISIRQGCCDSFTPQFVDLDNDGLKDLVTGQYFPGEVTWFRNTEEGFEPGIKLEQAGNPGARKDSRLPNSDPESFGYWSYSSASFGDFDGDGDYDLITGGLRLRISENIGGKTKPRFGPRKLLLDVNGDPLRVYPFTEEQLKEQSENGQYGYAGDLTSPLVVDWDQDGVLDLLVTGSYSNKGSNAVTFFRGVKTQNGHRFEPGKPLFTNKWGGKAFPGSWLRVYVTDWNNDGVNDLLIGASIATVKGGEFEHELSWSWGHETGTYKSNPGFGGSQGLAYVKKVVKLGANKERYKYLLNGGDPSLIHQGYVYVMLGEKR